MRKIYFDMDGTVYDLYGVEEWLDKLQSEDASAYSIGDPTVDLSDLQEVCIALLNNGYELGIITWLAKNGSKKFNKAVSETKYQWIKNNMPYVSTFWSQKYGTPKQNAIEEDVDIAILIDDNDNVRTLWNDKSKSRYSIKADENLINNLWKLIR